MKKYSLIIISTILFFLGGCKKFLDTSPADKYTQDNYWQTQERALAALNGVYASLLGNGLYGSRGMKNIPVHKFSLCQLLISILPDKVF